MKKTQCFPKPNRYCLELSGDVYNEDYFQSYSLSTEDKPNESSSNKISEKMPKIEASQDIIPSLEEIVRREIKDRGIEAVVKDCAEHSSKRCFVRQRNDKTDEQVRAMMEALAPGQTQLPKWKRVKLGKKIGLTESQIYKWYYDGCLYQSNKTLAKALNR